jgi:hypothetical protein
MFRCGKKNLIDNALQLTQAQYTIDHELLKNPYEIDIVKRDLTRNLTVLFPGIYDEISEAFDEYIPRTEGKIRGPV